MGLTVSLQDIVPSSGIDSNSGLSSKRAYGRAVSMTHAIFPPGYCSPPHAHEGEELAQLVEGELSVVMSGLKFSLFKGDFIRIPSMTVHWKRNRSALPAVMLELHNPAGEQVNSHSLLDSFERDDASFDSRGALRLGRTYRASHYYADGEDNFTPAPDDNPLFARWQKASSGSSAQQLNRVYASEGTNKGFQVAAESMSILYSERVGLKARPHFHAAEQISYVVEGEVWTFIEDRVVLARAGDFVRVPGNAIHWAMVKPGQKAVTFEVHTPLQGDPVAAHRTYLVPDHRIPLLHWIPGGFSSDALPAEQLEPMESELIEAASQGSRLQGEVHSQGVSATGSQR